MKSNRTTSSTHSCLPFMLSIHVIHSYRSSRAARRSSRLGDVATYCWLSQHTLAVASDGVHAMKGR